MNAIDLIMHRLKEAQALQELFEIYKGNSLKCKEIKNNQDLLIVDASELLDEIATDARIKMRGTVKRSIGQLCHHLDPIQMGVLYEMLQINANERGLNSPSSLSYLMLAEEVKDGIECNSGWDEYVNGDEHNKASQPFCRKLADYDNRMEWNEKR